MNPAATYPNLNPNTSTLRLPQRLLLYHLLAWAVFVFYEVSVVLVLNPTDTLWWEYTGYYALNILLFYLNAHLLLSYAFSMKRPFLLLLFLLPLEFGLYTIAKFGLELLYNLYRPSPIPLALDYRFVLGSLWRGVYFLGLSTAYWLVLDNAERNRKIHRLQLQQAEQEKREALLEKNLVQSQNAFLKSQISPHLLFNTLNFIYNDVEDVSPKAAEGIMLLSEVMHYSLKPLAEDGKAELSQELHHLKQYIALNQLRFRNTLQLQLQVTGKPQSHRIPPLVLITLLENIFKHGDLTDPDQPAQFSLQCHENLLQLSVFNKKRNTYINKGFGIGIPNTHTRLKEYYGEHGFQLAVQENDTHYSLALNIHTL